MQTRLDILVLGLSITSSWGNGHAVTYRGLVRELCARGHRVSFLERDVPWYAHNRDLPRPPWGTTALYHDVDELRRRWLPAIAAADAVIVGSYVPDGIEVLELVLEHARGVRAFYDIDTPVTLAALERGECAYLDARSIPELDLYLSFTGGPTLTRLEREFGARRARALYCSADPEVYRPLARDKHWQIGYLGTYSPDRQPRVDALLDHVARARPDHQFVVAGPQYPAELAWAPNVARLEHVPPSEHAEFYARQRLTLNVTRDDMIRVGWSPSIRLFEAAACGTAIVSDRWEGIETLLVPGEEILLADTTDDVLRILDTHDDAALAAIGQAARRKVLAAHTAAHRVLELERHLAEARAGTISFSAPSIAEPLARGLPS
jgi:spore maturation protein CgeB